MNLSKVRLVVADMDGTLLNSEGKVSARFFKQFELLKSNNIHFVAASGRQYFSISDKLDSIKDEITIIAENGGLAKHRETELVFTSLGLQRAKELVPILRQIDGAHIVLCGKDSAYLESKDMAFIELFREYYSKYTCVDDLCAVESDDIFKIAVYHFESSEKHLYPHVSHLENEMKVKVSGHNWLDISHTNAHKGFALKIVQGYFGISREETMVFGDFNNDLEMLAEADFSFAMGNAHENVKKAARYQTKSNNQQGVEIVLEELIRSKTK